MIRKWKKLVSLSLVLVMSIFVLAPTSVNANDIIASEDLAIGSESALYSVNGKNASAALCQVLEQYDVNICNSTLIEVRPLVENEQANVLVVTNEENGLLMKDVVLNFDEDGDVLPIVDVNQGDVSVCGGSTITRPTGKSYSIKATAVYNQRSNEFATSYYQPIGAYFFYYNTGNANVSYIKIEYSCDGFEYTYPGFVAVNNNVEYVHSIVVSRSSPAKSTMYQTVNEYRSDRVIYTATGSLNVGQYMAFTYTVDGDTQRNSVRIVD